jgi:hypothetical protein
VLRYVQEIFEENENVKGLLKEGQEKKKKMVLSKFKV